MMGQNERESALHLLGMTACGSDACNMKASSSSSSDACMMAADFCSSSAMACRDAQRSWVLSSARAWDLELSLSGVDKVVTHAKSARFLHKRLQQRALSGGVGSKSWSTARQGCGMKRQQAGCRHPSSGSGPAAASAPALER